MLNGLDLFSGIAGISLGLHDWVKTVCYCERDPFCQAVLLSRMASGEIDRAPIWDDITTFNGKDWNGSIDIIFGGFPCQDISVAGHGKGLEGERSGLFYEIARIAGDLACPYIFLENVPAITKRGGREVVGTFTKMGYDCKWCVISAASVGALHKRERWFLLAYSNSARCEKYGWIFPMETQQPSFECGSICQPDSKPGEQADKTAESQQDERRAWGRHTGQHWPFESREHWQEVVQSMDKCSDGLSNQVARLRSLGNSCVPAQCKKAFQILSGVN